MDHGVRATARHQVAVVQVGPVGEDFLHHRQILLVTGLAQFGQGRREENQRRIEVLDRGHHRPGDLHIGAGHVGERAVGLYVGHEQPFGPRHPRQRRQLVKDDGLQFRRGNRHRTAAEALQVRKADVGADADAGFSGQTQGAPHHQRIAGMKTAGDVRTGDGGEHLGIAAHLPGAEAFAEVGIEINGSGHGASRD